MNRIKKAMQQTAYEYGIPLSQVEYDIQNIIDECYNSSDPEISHMWRQICPAGAKPTAAQFITYATDMIRRERNKTETSGTKPGITGFLSGRFLA